MCVFTSEYSVDRGVCGQARLPSFMEDPSIGQVLREEETPGGEQDQKKRYKTKPGLKSLLCLILYTWKLEPYKTKTCFWTPRIIIDSVWGKREQGLKAEEAKKS